MEERNVVCGCLGVTMDDLENAVKNGARTFGEVKKITNVGLGCRGCVENVEGIVNQLIENEMKK